MEFKIRCDGCAEVPSLQRFKLNFAVIFVKVLLFLLLLESAFATSEDFRVQRPRAEQNKDNIATHSCIHDQIIEQRKTPGRKVYTVSTQVYIEPNVQKSLERKGRALLSVRELSRNVDTKKPIRIYLNYDAVGHSSDRDCRSVGDTVKALGQTAEWFRKALSVEPMKGNLRLSGYSACGQDGGVQLPREYVEGCC